MEVSRSGLNKDCSLALVDDVLFVIDILEPGVDRIELELGIEVLYIFPRKKHDI